MENELGKMSLVFSPVSQKEKNKTRRKMGFGQLEKHNELEPSRENQFEFGKSQCPKRLDGGLWEGLHPTSKLHSWVKRRLSAAAQCFGLCLSA